MNKRVSWIQRIWYALPIWLRQLAGFGMVGAVNIAVQYGSYYLLWALRLSDHDFYYTFCNMVSIFLTWIISYILYTLVVFKPRKKPENQQDESLKVRFGPRRTLRMMITHIAYLIFSSGLIVFFVETCGVSEGIASLVCIAVLVPYNFLTTKMWVYKDVE